jgi:uncharacterized protein with NAD-binding domain and iron-sulfur cluster
MTRTRVAILGGGAGAVAAAFELTATPELREAYEVTVHTLGWRLGGKGASGRNPDQAQRIEEHGLHIWFGFYDNAFAAMRSCYEELGRPPDAPLATWSDAFKPRDDCVQYELFEGEWVPHHFTLPRNSLTPGDPGSVSVWEMMRAAFDFLERSFLELDTSRPPGGVIERLARARLRIGLRLLFRRTAQHARRSRHTAGELRVAAALVGRVRTWAWRHIVSKHLQDKQLRLFYMWLDLTAAMVAGISADRLLERGFGAINNEEFRAWLLRHGASPMTAESSPMVRAIYDAAFCYEEGDISKPNVAAGKAAQDLIRSIFLYKGALMYKMQAGMGDTVFGPFYEVLRRRGVRFEFFHCVTRLGTGPDGGDVQEIEFVPQATVRGETYEPLVDVLGLPCWPSDPDWSQLEEGEQLKALGVNIEQDSNPLGHAPITLRRGEDFDVCVLAIPVGALAPICTELAAANERFSQMIETSSTVMTQAVQLWLTRDASELGFPYEVGSLASCFAEPLDTYCDMNQLLVREAWPSADDVRQIAYFCGVLPHAGLANQQQADERARSFALDYLARDAQIIWPGAHGKDAFDWNLLVDTSGAAGEARFDSQYCRANFSGSERYALTVAGSVEYRLWPAGSGFQNLFLAGDWTRNGIDGGSVEAAITSGMLAARGISGSPAVVRGTTGVLESDRGEPSG